MDELTTHKVPSAPTLTKHVVVIGGGFAGAAAASSLAEAGYAVTLLEQRPVLGGRTSSLKDGVTGEDIDNGQHIFLGAYHDTRKFLRRLKTESRLKFMPILRIPFRAPGRRPAVLKSRLFSGPWGMMAGVLGFSELSAGAKISLVRALLSVKLFKQGDLTKLTVNQWLDKLRQSAGTRRAFWTPLCLATLNEQPDVACAEALAIVLREAFLRRSDHMTLGYATLSLGKLWSMELTALLKQQGGVVSHRQSVTNLEVAGNRVAKVVLQTGETVEADAVISAASLPAFLKYCPEDLKERYQTLEEVTYSSILSVDFWFSKPLFDEPLLGLLDTRFHWAFNRHKLWEGRGTSPGHVALVMSGAGTPEGRAKPAGHVSTLSQEEITDLAYQELKKCFPSLTEPKPHAAVIWEKQATPSPSPANWTRRPPVATSLENFFLAGDWVDSGLPATIEAACRSGHWAAEQAKKYLSAMEGQRVESSAV